MSKTVPHEWNSARPTIFFQLFLEASNQKKLLHRPPQTNGWKVDLTHHTLISDKIWPRCQKQSHTSQIQLVCQIFSFIWQSPCESKKSISRQNFQDSIFSVNFQKSNFFRLSKSWIFVKFQNWNPINNENHQKTLWFLLSNFKKSIFSHQISKNSNFLSNWLNAIPLRWWKSLRVSNLSLK